PSRFVDTDVPGYRTRTGHDEVRDSWSARTGGDPAAIRGTRRPVGWRSRCAAVCRDAHRRRLGGVPRASRRVVGHGPAVPGPPGRPTPADRRTIVGREPVAGVHVAAHPAAAVE